MTSLERLKVYAATGCTVTLSPTDVRMLCDLFTEGDRQEKRVFDLLARCRKANRLNAWLLGASAVFCAMAWVGVLL